MARQPVNDAGPSATRDQDDLLSSLDQLDSGEIVQLTRTSPLHMAGIIGDFLVPDGGGADIPNLIKASYGGGGYRVQRKVKLRNGMRFGQGCASFQIAGEPLDPSAKSTVSSAPIVVQGAGGSDISGRVLQILQDALTQARGSAPAGQATDIVGLINALQTTLAGGQRIANPDPFESIDKAMGTLAKMRAAMGGRRNREDDEDDDEDTPKSPFSKMFGGMNIAEMFMMKMLNDQGGMGGLAGMFGGLPQPPWQTAQPPQMPPPPPNSVYHPQFGWIPYPAAHPASAQPVAHAATPPSRPRAADPLVTTATNAVPKDTITNDETMREKAETLPSEVEDYEPLEVSDIVDDLRARDPKEREAFLMKIFEQLSSDPEFQGTVNGAAPSVGATPDG